MDDDHRGKPVLGRRPDQVAGDRPIALGRSDADPRGDETRIVRRDLDGQGVVRPQRLEQRRGGEAAGCECLRAREKAAPADPAMHIGVEQVEQALREVGGLFPFHPATPV